MRMADVGLEFDSGVAVLTLENEARRNALTPELAALLAAACDEVDSRPEIGAAVIGTETELILKSRWVLPKRLLDSGFKFKFNSADDAIRNIAGREQACEGSLRTVLREPQHDIHRSAS